jgi:hypothetical protein
MFVFQKGEKMPFLILLHIFDSFTLRNPDLVIRQVRQLLHTLLLGVLADPNQLSSFLQLIYFSPPDHSGTTGCLYIG